MRRLLLLATSCLIFAACNEDDDDNEFIIKTGMECGWCGGMDSLVVIRSATHYIFDNPCDNSKDKDIHEKTAPQEWDELLSTLNWNEFVKVNVNTCAVCVDGCDTWIWIQNNETVHQIRFTETSPEIEPIRDFIETLQAYHKKFRTN
jgi:hypothetical protein